MTATDIWIDVEDRTYLCQYYRESDKWRAFHVTGDGRYFAVLVPEVFNKVIKAAREKLAVQRLTS